MFDPRSIVIYRPPLVVGRYDGTDYGTIPWRVRLNPLRYDLTLFPGPNRVTINRNGWLWRKVSDALFALRNRLGFGKR